MAYTQIQSYYGINCATVEDWVLTGNQSGMYNIQDSEIRLLGDNLLDTMVATNLGTGISFENNVINLPPDPAEPNKNIFITQLTQKLVLKGELEQIPHTGWTSGNKIQLIKEALGQGLYRYYFNNPLVESDPDIISSQGMTSLWFACWNDTYSRYDLITSRLGSSSQIGAPHLLSGISTERSEYPEVRYVVRAKGIHLVCERDDDDRRLFFRMIFRGEIVYEDNRDLVYRTFSLISKRGGITSDFEKERARNTYLALANDAPITPPSPYSAYEPIAYFKGNKTFFQMSMIKREYTNNGNVVEEVPASRFERILSGDDLHALAKQLPLNTERNFAFTDDNNYVSITRTSVDSETNKTTYVLQFYTDGVFTNFVTYVCHNEDKYHFSFLVDKEHHLARPSIIREYIPDGRHAEFFDYNKEATAYIGDEHLAEWYTWLSTSLDTEIPDPYSFGGNSETTPSTSGNYDRGSDTVGVPPLPTFNATSLGFFRAYLGNSDVYDSISDLSDYLWSINFDIDTFKKLFANPIQSVLSIHVIPLAITSSELGRHVHLGNIDTGLNMQPVASQFIELNCGTLKVSEYFGSYLDYSPYTRLSLFLPFIGVVPLGIDEIMGKSLGVKYHIDVYTGACVAFVTADGKVLYHFSGMCALNVPITSADASNIASSAISIGNTVATVVATAVTGGATAPLIVPSVANTASNVFAGKSSVQRSGSLSSSVGFMDNPTPYIILEVPEQCHPEDLNKFKGYPTHATFTLGALKGYTEIEEVHLENMTCTAREAQEIETLLKGGVIL